MLLSPGWLDLAVWLLGVVGVIGILVVAVSALHRAFRGQSHRLADHRALTRQAGHLLRLEERLEDLASEQARLAEKERFLTQLLSERRSDRERDAP